MVSGRHIVLHILFKIIGTLFFRALVAGPESGEGSARSICDDTFSVFAFLAFILALTSLGLSAAGSNSKEFDTFT